MKTKKVKFIAALIFTIIGLLMFIPELSAFNVTASEIIGTLSLSAVITPIYYEGSTGRPVYSASSLRASGAVNDVAPGGATTPAMCVCDAVNPYRVPNTITLTGTSTGVGSVGKLTPFDDAAEAVQGTLGTIFMGVAEIPFGAGTIAKQDGTFIFAGDVIRNITATRMLVIDKITMFGTDVAGLAAATLNYVRGYIGGNDNTLLNFSLQTNNQTAVTVLEWSAAGVIPGGLLYWKSNEGWQYTFATAAGLINIRMSIKGYQYYGN